MATARIARSRGPSSTATNSASVIEIVPISAVHPDPTNPRKPDTVRLGLLRLSLTKLGFIQPLFVTPDGMLLSGHQRTHVATEMGFTHVPIIRINLPKDVQGGVNILFNRATNDFTAFDTGSSALGRLDLDTVLAAAEQLPDLDVSASFAINCKEEAVAGIVNGYAERYDKKATALASSILKMGIRIPAVVSESGIPVNGIHRLFASLENGEATWPVIRIPDANAEVALNFLNYLSMDFHVDQDFERLLRYSAYRRPQNNRGVVPKAYRFWANGERTLLDKDSYTTEYWVKFRDLHGHNIIDFGAGLGKVAPYLQTKGMNAIDFEPYRIDPDKEVGVPDPAYSRQQARRFLNQVSDPKVRFDSIFLASVLNSVPFPQDRLCVLAIVHALSSRNTVVYGTCRDISDFNYEYGGIRNANYFVMDGESGVRLGDVARNPKIQKFETQDSARAMFSRFWKGIEFWPGGNVFYYKLTAPMGFRPDVIAQALEFEFENLPFSDGTTMGLGKEAKAAFSKRLGVTIK
jgi:hypothetical protein